MGMLGKVTEMFVVVEPTDLEVPDEVNSEEIVAVEDHHAPAH